MAYSGDVRDKAYQFYQALVGNAGTLEDMKAKYFISQVGGADPHDAERNYLQSQGGTGNSINELWRSYLRTRGYSGKLSNMLNSFYQGDSFSTPGYSMDFATGTQKITIPHATSVDITGNFTFAAWIYPRTVSEEFIIDKDSETATGVGMCITGTYFALTNPLIVRINNTIYNSNTLFYSANSWTHCAVTYDGTNMKFYKNGTLDRSVACTTNPTTNSSAMIIGNNSAGTRDFDGMIDEVIVYKGRVLDATEISNIYNQKEPTVTSLSAYYKFLVGSGATAHDYSGNMNHGTISGATWSSNNKTPANKGLLFNGSGNRSTSTLWNSMSSGYSFGAWFKSTDYTRTEQTIMSTGDGGVGGLGLGIVLSGNSLTNGTIFALNHNKVWKNMGFAVQNNSWNHIFFVVDSVSAITPYLNGVAQTQVTGIIPNLVAPTIASYIGAMDSSGARAFKGSIDGAQMYDSALTAQEVQDIYYYGATDVKPTNRYSFTEGSGSTATDTGTAAKDGTITGAVYTDGHTIPAIPSTYTSQYPPAQNSTYVIATSSVVSPDYDPYNATNPLSTKTGAWINNVWAGGTNVTLRMNIDLGSAKTIVRIYYENGHDSGTNTDAGLKTFTFWGSNTAGAFADTTYATDTNWTAITTSQATFDQHTGSDIADPKYITATNAVAYRYYSIKVADTWGGGGGYPYMAIRRIELQTVA